MEDAADSKFKYTVEKETPELAASLIEMKEVLDKVRSKVQALTVKVKEDNYPTSDGISYLDAKHLLLVNYCQSLVYYLLRKARGVPIVGHEVVHSLVEIRLFFEKIRPIDKKLQYQIQKLTRAASGETINGHKKQPDAPEETEDLFRPNRDMMKPAEDDSGIYRPPKFAPTTMSEDKMSREERNSLRKEKESMRRVRENDYSRSLINEAEGRPEEHIENVGDGSRELQRFKAKMDERARQEEEQFTRVPLTKMEKKKGRHLQKSRDGLLGLTENFYDDIRSLPLADVAGDEIPRFNNGRGPRGRNEKQRKRKRKH